MFENGENAMPTERQLAANRLNAQRSTGPRTEAGKSRSSGNSMKHGLTARSPVIAGEDPEEYERLRAGILQEYMPQGPLEETLAEIVAATLWRLRRVPFLEACILVFVEQRSFDETDPVDEAMRLEIRETSDKYLGRLPADPSQVRIGRMLEQGLTRGDLIGKLSNYEGQLLKRLERTIDQLNRAIASRPVDLPHTAAAE